MENSPVQKLTVGEISRTSLHDMEPDIHDRVYKTTITAS
jgi:hypothetical protein